MLDPNSTIPLGLCRCGCGRETNIARDSSARYGHTKGQPYFYLTGHSGRKSPEARLAEFWARVDRSGGPDACWPWLGTIDRDGYGKVADGDRSAKRAHRFACEAVGKPIDPALHACHTCDNPPCCNPDHVFPGTPLDNAADCVRKGRRLVDEAHPNSKLTDEGVALAWNLLDAKVPQTEIAARLGVCQATIGHIHTGRNRRGQRPTLPKH